MSHVSLRDKYRGVNCADTYKQGHTYEETYQLFLDACSTCMHTNKLPFKDTCTRAHTHISSYYARTRAAGQLPGEEAILSQATPHRARSGCGTQGVSAHRFRPIAPSPAPTPAPSPRAGALLLGYCTWRWKMASVQPAETRQIAHGCDVGAQRVS